MKIVLLVTASSRHEGSSSRAAASRFVGALKSVQPAWRIVERDLAAQIPAPITGAWAGALHTPATARTPAQSALLAESDRLIAEVKAADAVVIATPMYNFGVPSPLKSWVDATARSGETFAYEPASGYRGLLSGKKGLILVSSAGDYAPGSPAAAADFATPYLRFILGFIGINDTSAIALPNQAGDQRAAATATAYAKLDDLAHAWTT